MSTLTGGFLFPPTSNSPRGIPITENMAKTEPLMCSLWSDRGKQFCSFQKEPVTVRVRANLGLGLGSLSHIWVRVRVIVSYMG